MICVGNIGNIGDISIITLLPDQVIIPRKIFSYVQQQLCSLYLISSVLITMATWSLVVSKGFRKIGKTGYWFISRRYKSLVIEWKMRERTTLESGVNLPGCELELYNCRDFLKVFFTPSPLIGICPQIRTLFFGRHPFYMTVPGF